MSVDRPRRLARRTVYENPWVSLYVDRVEFPAGYIVEEHHVLEFAKDAVAVLAENDAGQLLMVEAYRYVTNCLEWEIPAGNLEPGEAVLAAAARELVEETGYSTVDHRHLYTFTPISGIGDKVHHLVACRTTGEPAGFDRNEVRAVRWVERDEVEAIVRTSGVRDGYTLTGLLWWLWAGRQG
jgi:ADP-ribose pyrophosphatase